MAFRGETYKFSPHLTFGYNHMRKCKTEEKNGWFTCRYKSRHTDTHTHTHT